VHGLYFDPRQQGAPEGGIVPESGRSRGRPRRRARLQPKQVPDDRIPLQHGITALDRVFRGLLPGDNLVWQIDSVGDFAPFVPAYCARRRRRAAG